MVVDKLASNSLEQNSGETGGEPQPSQTPNEQAGVIQGLLFPTIDIPLPSALREKAEDPIKKPSAKKRSKVKPEKSPLIPGLIKEKHEEFTLSYPDYPDFKPKFIRTVIDPPSTVKGSHGEIIVPDTWQEFEKLYGLSPIFQHGITAKKEQIRGTILSLEAEKNLFLVADCGFGKTIVIFALAAAHLQQNRDINRVLIVTKSSLVEDIYNSAKSKINISADSIAAITSQPKEDRSDILADQNIKIVVAPAGKISTLFENNGEEPPQLDPKLFSLVIFDEADLAIGETGWVKIGKSFVAANIPVRLFSATLPDKDNRFSEISETFNLCQKTAFRKLHSLDRKVFEAEIIAEENDPDILTVRDSLFKQVKQTAEELYRNLTILASGEQGVRILAEKLQNNFKKATRIHENRFVFLSNDFYEDFRKSLDDLGVKFPSLEKKPTTTGRHNLSLLDNCRTLLSELGHRSHLYHTLTRFGKSTFLTAVAEQAWAYRFNVSRPKGKNCNSYFFKKIYSGFEGDNNKLAACFRTLTPENSLFSLIANKVHYQDLAKRISSTSPIDATSLRTPFIQAALEEVFNSKGWHDGVLVNLIRKIALRHSTMGESNKVLIYTESKSLAKYLESDITRLLKHVGNPARDYTATSSITGNKKREFTEKLRQDFKTGNAPILIAGDSLGRGWDEDIQVLVKITHSPETSKHKQIIGRVARREGSTGYVYNILIPDTLDFQRFYALQKRLKKEKDRVRDD